MTGRGQFFLPPIEHSADNVGSRVTCHSSVSKNVEGFTLSKVIIFPVFFLCYNAFRFAPGSGLGSLFC